MATSSAPRPVVALPRPDTLAVLGAELLFVGGLAAILPAQVQPGVVIGVGAAIGATLATLSAAITGSSWHSTARAITSLFLSFASMVPGVFFLVELFRPRGNSLMCYEPPYLACYERPWSGVSALWVLAGPALLVVSMMVAPWRPKPGSLFVVLTLLHALLWLLVTGIAMACAIAI
jgi:hypothetical protein